MYLLLLNKAENIIVNPHGRTGSIEENSWLRNSLQADWHKWGRIHIFGWVEVCSRSAAWGHDSLVVEVDSGIYWHGQEWKNQLQWVCRMLSLEFDYPELEIPEICVPITW